MIQITFQSKSPNVCSASHVNYFVSSFGDECNGPHFFEDPTILCIPFFCVSCFIVGTLLHCDVSKNIPVFLNSLCHYFFSLGELICCLFRVRSIN